MLLLDSNILIYHLSGDPVAAFLTEERVRESFISVVSMTEVLAKPDLKKSEIELIEDFLGEFKVIDVTPKIGKEAAALKRKYALSFPDAIIAATAKLYGLHLVSKDKVFSKITELRQVYLD